MGDNLSNLNHQDYLLNRELKPLIREIEYEEALRRNVIDMLVGLGSDDALRCDV